MKITDTVPLLHFQRNSIPEMQEFLTRCEIDIDGLDNLNVIHVAGTKGKGSTCAFTESLLRKHGLKTGYLKNVLPLIY